jgi:phosphoglycerate kinase
MTDPAAMLAFSQAILGVNANVPKKTLPEYLKAIPRLDSLASIPSGTPVLVRGDVDAKPGKTIGEGDIRLRSMVETLKYGQSKGWKLIVFGHRGRKPEETLEAVGKRLSELLGSPVELVTDWLDESTNTIRDSVTDKIDSAVPGSVLLLENTRKYDIERVLWKAKPAELPGLSEKLAKIANEYATKVAKVYVNEALSAGSLDTSTVVVPAAMDRVALGAYVANEFDGPMLRCLAAELVVFSGLKTDKLDDLEAVIGRGSVKMVFVAGSLALAVKKADALLAGKDFSLGVAEDPAHADKPYYIAPDRIEQAKRMLSEGRSKGIEFVLPVDFVLQDGKPAETLKPTDQQFDVGPKTSEYFAGKVGEFIDKHKGKPAVAFYNGVFGMFEDPRFEDGTRKFIAQLKRMKDAGIEVYVGGGEGGEALNRYGSESDCTHCFTAGGTVLNALGSEPVPYLVALMMAANKTKTTS